jgi:hypothetical protein
VRRERFTCGRGPPCPTNEHHAEPVGAPPANQVQLLPRQARLAESAKSRAILACVQSCRPASRLRKVGGHSETTQSVLLRGSTATCLCRLRDERSTVTFAAWNNTGGVCDTWLEGAGKQLSLDSVEPAACLPATRRSEHITKKKDHQELLGHLQAEVSAWLRKIELAEVSDLRSSAEGVKVLQGNFGIL